MFYSEPEFAGFYSISIKQDRLKSTNPRSKQRAPGSHMLYPCGGPTKTFQIKLLFIMKKTQTHYTALKNISASIHLG